MANRPSKHWYYVYMTECCMCGRSDAWRERRYTPRPTEWWDRHEWRSAYCGCMY